MSTGTQNDLGLQTFIVRIYRPRDGARPSALSGTVEIIPGGSLHAFDGARQLGALLARVESARKKSRRRASPKQSNPEQPAEERR